MAGTKLFKAGVGLAATFAAALLLAGLSLESRPGVASADHSNRITIAVDSPEGGAFEFLLLGPAGCLQQAFSLEDDASASFECDSGEIAISLIASPGFRLSGAPRCGLDSGNDGDAAGVGSDWETEANGDIAVDLTDREHLLCTYSFELSGGKITVTKQAAGAGSRDFDFLIEAVVGDCDAAFALEDGQSVDFFCHAPGRYLISEVGAQGAWDLVDITCTDRGIAAADIAIDIPNRRLQVDLKDAGETLTCTFKNEELPGPRPAPGPPSNISVASIQSTISCLHTTRITVVVKDAGGRFVSDGTPITLTADHGEVLPASQVTSGGSLSALYVAERSFAGTATVTAAASGASGSAQINVECAEVAATATQAAAPTPTPGVITPPSTGGGRLSSGGRGLDLTLAMVAVITATASLSLLLFYARRSSPEAED